MQTQYYKKIKNKRVAIFGITPPPLGGVSVHIQRVAEKFKQNNNKVYHFKTEFRGRRYLLFLYLIYAFIFLLFKKIDILYYHSSYLPNSIQEILFLSYIKKLLKFNFILVEHNYRHMYLKKNLSKIKLNKFIKNIDHIIFMGNLPQKSYFDNKINIEKKHTIDDAFLPPDLSEENKILKKYPKELYEFIHKSKPSLLVNASKSPLTEGKDLYGFDKSIKVVSKLKKHHPNIGLILIITTMENCQYLNHLLKTIKDLNIENNVLFLTGQKELWPILKKIDIFLRPTLWDGTSISLREAIYFNKTVVASNVCKRPPKTTVFDIKNENDFFEKTKNEINKKFVSLLK